MPQRLVRPESAPDALYAVRLSVLDGARECDSDMRRTGFIDDRNNSHKLCVSRRAAEPAGPPGDRESATYRDDLCGCRLTLIRRETHDVHEQLIAIGGGKHFGPHNTAVRITDHHGLLNESAQMRRLTRTGRGTIMRIVASERTPIGPECGERESHDQHERHHQACRSPAMSLVHCLPSLKRVVEPFASTERGSDFLTLDSFAHLAPPPFFASL